MKIESLQPYCYPIEISTNIDELMSSINVLLSRLGLSLDNINTWCKSNFAYTINLTHLNGLTGSDRWRKYNEGHFTVKAQGVSESNFTEHLEEANDLLIGKLIKQIYEYHENKFQGRAQLIWLGANKQYKFHRDLHTPNRYHVPLITNEKCYWLFRDNKNIYNLHMPADGRIWYLDPINVEHTFRNESQEARLHLLLTSGY